MKKNCSGNDLCIVWNECECLWSVDFCFQAVNVQMKRWNFSSISECIGWCDWPLTGAQARLSKMDDAERRPRKPARKISAIFMVHYLFSVNFDLKRAPVAMKFGGLLSSCTAMCFAGVVGIYMIRAACLRYSVILIGHWVFAVAAISGYFSVPMRRRARFIYYHHEARGSNSPPAEKWGKKSNFFLQTPSNFTSIDTFWFKLLFKCIQILKKGDVFELEKIKKNKLRALQANCFLFLSFFSNSKH